MAKKTQKRRYYIRTGENAGVYYGIDERAIWLSTPISVTACEIASRTGAGCGKAVFVEFKDPADNIHRAVFRAGMAAGSVRGFLLRSGLHIAPERASRKLFHEYIFGAAK